MTKNPSIILDKERGVNPRLTYCQRCGGESPELILLGNQDYVRHCGKCDIDFLGPKGVARCPKCKSPHTTLVRRLDEHERLPSIEPCDKCTAEIEEHKKVVEEGGVYWKCRDCKNSGVLRATSELSISVRQKSGIEKPNPVCIEFTKDDCPLCTGQVQKPEGREVA